MFFIKLEEYTLWISRCIATARERIPGSIGNYVTGVRECSQQRSNLKDNGYIQYYHFLMLMKRCILQMVLKTLLKKCL
ncbi:hypothetical protein [Photorhabdus sp. RW14-46]|uniref:hypothetical protein n=1 Tax=Photorhabdus sp. RW14-46 TaxID=2100168 RepID=UPI001A97E53A|nr:hypothetical protein [Photorhabdus sp. RW14-46]